MKRCFLSVLLGAALAWTVPITLQEALSMAKSGNAQIKAERAEVALAEAGNMLNSKTVGKE